MSDLLTVSTVIVDPEADNKQLFIFQAPSAGRGGGVTILSAAAETLTSQTAGTSFSLQLLKYSSAGTPAVNGTISGAIGGTAATYWHAGIPQSFVINTTYAFLDAGEWLVLDYQEDGTVTMTGGINFTSILQIGN